MKYNLYKPCADCPFRSDRRPFIRADRAEEILESDAPFPCHKTVDYSEDCDGRETENTQHCAGVLILLEHENRPHQMMRIAERLRLYDRSKLDMSAPVYESIDDCIEQHEMEDA